MKEKCERCGCSPRAPRRRCSQCGKRVCVSNCWSRSSKTCTSCAPDRDTTDSERSGLRCKVCKTSLKPADSRCPKCFWLVI